MSKTCGECTYLNIEPGKGDFYGKFPCEKKWEYHLATDPECDRFCTAYDRNYNSIQNAYRYYNEHSSSSEYYLTTMLCNILKMPDNNIYLETMTNLLKSFYELATVNVTTLEIENIDIKKSGHGIYKTKKITPNV